MIHFPDRSLSCIFSERWQFVRFTVSLIATSIVALGLSFTLVEADDDGAWRELFDGKNLDGWTATNFGGEGKVEIDAGRIVLGFGSDLTGITWKGPLPRFDYEVKLEARREEGNDFFCGLTFPVNDSYCSLILGGWGGTVMGLSSIDGLDASENETSRLISFDLNRWYAVTLKVTQQKIEAWIDGTKIVDQELSGRKISIRPEVELSRPFGIASWRTRAGLRKMAMRKIDARR
jgi:3-keto-disaccharide hydrolase